MKQIKEILKEFPQYWNGEQLQRPVVIDDLKNYDALLISALLKNQKIRENYSAKAGDVVIFKVQEFIDILRYKDYWADSYTKYSNTIGLSSEGKYLQYNTDVVLDFPYKDCVLEGGMTKEDTGKEEVFYNEVIARDEIDTLLAPKAFVNVKKYDADGEHKVDSFSNEDNLIIKGNNLLALHSLKGRYAGKVKLIYIDPPYNTGKDGFQYNDKFNRSSWLTFMNNRLQSCYDLLTNEGVILVQITDKEGHYLKVLMDGIFGENNFICQIIWKKRGGAPNDKVIGAVHEYILMYAKNVEQLEIFKMKRNKEQLARYKNPDNHPKGAWASDNLMANVKGGRYVKSLYYPIINPNTGEEFYPSSNGNWRYNKARMQDLLDNEEIFFGIDGKGRPKLKRFLSDLKDGVPYSTIWDDIPKGNSGTREVLNLFGSVNIFDTAKPEGLIKRVLDMTTKENDIILDFFMGSATTQSVAMKMNRRFIGIEQMDYINTVSVPRLQKVIEGEQGGISKDVNWQGGGSFVYAELMELNQEYVSKIDQASTKEELSNLWDELDNNADLNFQLDKEKLTNELLKEHDEEEGSITFNDLTFDEQKEIFKKALDKNQLYVPYSEIEDKNVSISDDDKAFNHSFYSNEGE